MSSQAPPPSGSEEPAPSGRGSSPPPRLEPLEDIGRARRFRCQAGELWCLAADDHVVAARLRRMGERNLGGFVDGGSDDEGLWLVRRTPTTTLSREMRQRRQWPWEEALDVMLAVARAQAVAEAASVFACPVTPDAIALDDGHAWLMADGFVAALLGAPAGTVRATDTRPKALLWLPPEKVESATGDNAANRYAIAALLYQLMAGQHPFGGAGLRHALREARDLEPAPLPDDVATKLPAGLQSMLLRMLDPNPRRRLDRAAELVAKLESIRAGDAPTSLPAAELVVGVPGSPSQQVAVDPSQPPPALPPREPAGAAGQIARLASKPGWRFAPIAVALLVLGATVALVRDPPAPETEESPTVGSVDALDPEHTTAQDCARCHARQAAEWSQSVMGHSVKSPLFNALEVLIEEQVGRDFACPNGAGILRRADQFDVCRDRQTGIAITGSGGEHWCVNCHSPGENIRAKMPAWRAIGDPTARHPIKDLIEPAALEGISCAFCHQVRGPVGPSGSGGYEGNADWVSFITGERFFARPEDRFGLFGIGNSGYQIDAAQFLLSAAPERPALVGEGRSAVHARPTEDSKRYLASSEFCGSCHDVRLFGTDVIGAQHGERFKRLRNAYSEWRAWAADEAQAGRAAASCQGCHMSSYPGVCVADEAAVDDGGCPDGMRFDPHEPGRLLSGRVANNSSDATAVSTHYFAAVDLPLAAEIEDAVLDQDGVDVHGIPLSARRRRNMLLQRSMSLTLEPSAGAGDLNVAVIIENTGAGHRVPAGFSQEREIWVHLRVTDAQGRVVYEVGRVERNDEDLHDKQFVFVNTNPDSIDAQGRPVGLFAADVRDGPDVPLWSPPPELGGDLFRGRGLVNFQNGFLRCVTCIGTVNAEGECVALPSQFGHRAARFVDGGYDLDTGECVSNLTGRRALFETYFPVGGLDATRGLVKGPDAIIDTRSLAPAKPVRYIYELATRGRPGPFNVEARLMFRSFPPFLVRAFADYEQRQSARGLRPSGPLVTFDMLERLERVVVARRELVVP